MTTGAGQPLDLADLGRRLDERIDAAIVYRPSTAIWSAAGPGKRRPSERNPGK